MPSSCRDRFQLNGPLFPPEFLITNGLMPANYVPPPPQHTVGAPPTKPPPASALPMSMSPPSSSSASTSDADAHLATPRLRAPPRPPLGGGGAPFPAPGIAADAEPAPPAWDLTPTEKKHATFDIQLARADVAPYAFAPSPPQLGTPAGSAGYHHPNHADGTPSPATPSSFAGRRPFGGAPAASAEPALDPEPRALEPKTEGSHTVSPRPPARCLHLTRADTFAPPLL
jgi:hypothetical protein